METNYYQKYLKYKNKYLQLKAQLDGGSLPKPELVELVKYNDSSYSLWIWDAKKKSFKEIFNVEVKENNGTKIVELNRTKTKKNNDFIYNGKYSFQECVKNTNGECYKDTRNKVLVKYICSDVKPLQK
jgi:hypothetical protein